MRWRPPNSLYSNAPELRIIRVVAVMNTTLTDAELVAAAKTGDDYAAYHRDLRRFSRRYWGSPLTAEYWRLELSWMRHFALRPLRQQLGTWRRQIFPKRAPGGDAQS